ncbi:MAG: MTH938/NDUFAF3 family protein [Candidatus Omnitrophica bacterium]|nr:MTH938/NDUFAF3 family protein [Candidatus Omnitrophota bacterium]MCM8798934.1 MTH938/NDUFAF3 family protein [Candidatus Omnitrophota bacterium]
MPKVEGYRFGEILIEDKLYRSDLIIYPHKIDASWWRKAGHILCLEDIKEVLAEKPEVIIIGTGAAGLLSVLEEVKEKTKALGIELVIHPTDKACQEYNKISKEKKTIACLHLTC